MKTQLEPAIQKGLEYLATQQEEDGSFISYLSFDSTIPDCTRPIKTVFIPALILASLANITKPECLKLRHKSVNFLLSQKSAQWTFNFLSRDEPEKQTRNYPDDLDDTFCTYIALHAHDPTLITTNVLVRMTKILLATETAVGGPYRTWLAPPDSEKIWLDVDVAVNSNIAYFLSLVSQVPPGLQQYITQSIEASRLSSPYYVPTYPILYYLARIPIEPSVRRKISQLLTQAKSKNSRMQPIEHALTATSYIRIANSEKYYLPHIKALLDAQQPDGSWAAGGFCTDQYTAQGVYYNGSSALTTAFALEAIALYQKTLEKTRAKAIPALSQPRLSSLEKNVTSYIRKDIKNLEPLLQKTLYSATSRLMQSANGKEIMHFAQSLNASLHNPLPLSHPSFTTLGAANVYGWVAYTIYDDFIDEEGTPMLLPAANVAMRKAHELYLNALPGNQAFSDFVRQSFDRIDAANTWEVEHCRFHTYKKRTITVSELPDYEDLSPLAERSIGHALSPLAVLAKSGASIGSPDFQAVFAAIKHYIIAKQLNDDAHDWQEDMLYGRITYVVTLILSELDVPQGTYRFDTLLPAMQKRFWYHTLTTVCGEMQHQVALSRTALAKTSLLEAANPISKLLDTIDISIQDTLKKQFETKEFLEYF